jgi:dienelactone hydrolase
MKPEGTGPFPAIVMMHDCSGLGPRSSGAPGRWAKELVAQGYVIVMPDSFSTRGFPNGVCTDASPKRVDVRPGVRVRDAREALAYARSLPEVDGRRVGIMGGSHGGTTTLAALAAPRGFAAGIALYPRCGFFTQFRGSAPLLILAGELDDWTPAAECRLLANAEKVTLKVYPGVHHSFDSPRPKRYVAERINSSSPSGRGATTEGNAAAWADSIREVQAFFARHLKDAN